MIKVYKAVRVINDKYFSWLIGDVQGRDFTGWELEYELGKEVKAVGDSFLFVYKFKIESQMEVSLDNEENIEFDNGNVSALIECEVTEGEIYYPMREVSYGKPQHFELFWSRCYIGKHKGQTNVLKYRQPKKDAPDDPFDYMIVYPRGVCVKALKPIKLVDISKSYTHYMNEIIKGGSE